MRRRGKAGGGKSLWLFAGASYYPGGGMEDLVGRFGSVAEAKAEVAVGSTPHVDAAHWTDERHVMMTSLVLSTVVSIGGVRQPSRPTWAVDPPDDAPPRPSEWHWWFPERTWFSNNGPDWAHIVDARTATVIAHLGYAGVWIDGPDDV